MKGSPAVIEMLQQAVSAEALSERQYLCDAEMLDILSLPGLAKQLRKLGKDERHHGKDFSRQLVFFETAPIIAPDPTIRHANVSELLANQLRLETIAVTLYTSAIEVCIAERDYATRRVFEDTLMDEIEHVRFVESQIETMKQAGGEGQYIQAFIAVEE